MCLIPMHSNFVSMPGLFAISMPLNSVTGTGSNNGKRKSFFILKKLLGSSCENQTNMITLFTPNFSALLIFVALIVSLRVTHGNESLQ